jgi:hypothetical protein
MRMTSSHPATGLLAPRTQWIVEARAVDEDVHLGVTGEDRVCDALDRSRIAHVERFRLGLAAGAADGSHFAREHLGAPARHHDSRARGRELLRAREPHAGTGAGHPRQLAIEIAHRSSPVEW